MTWESNVEKKLLGKTITIARENNPPLVLVIEGVVVEEEVLMFVGGDFYVEVFATGLPPGLKAYVFKRTDGGGYRECPLDKKKRLTFIGYPMHHWSHISRFPLILVEGQILREFLQKCDEDPQTSEAGTLVPPSS